MQVSLSGKLIALACLALSSPVVRAQALPFLPAGDARLRHEVELDDDTIPLTTTWPLPSRDLSEDQALALRSVSQPGSATDAGWFVDGGAKPTRLRVYDDTPREKGEAGVQGGWAAGDYAGGVMRLAYDFKPQDQMHYRVDDSYASWRYGNWWVTIGAQERWWGPGWDGSLIFGNNARPMPGLSLDRASALAPEADLLHWIGPWRFTTFIDRMEDRRPDYGKILFWGTRVSFAPVHGLEIGLSRTAQLCGTGRKCGLKVFWDTITARKNAVIDESGPNANLQAKPAANHAAVDVRWHIPHTPIAVYWQQDGEVIDSGNYRLRQNLQLIGVELANKRTASGSYRAFVEFADTACGGLSTASSDKPDYGCAYEKDTYQAGYRFRGRSIGDAMDRDGRRFTFGNVWVDGANRSWDLRLRRLELNRGGVAFGGLVPQTVSAVRKNVWEVSSQVEGTYRGYVYTLGGALDRTNTETDPAAATWKQGWEPSAYISVSHPW